jgi:TolB protein
MRSTIASLFGALLRLLVWPFRWLWQFIGRLGLAAHKLLIAVWRFLGRMGLALTTVLGSIGRLLWRPIRWLLLGIGKLLIAIWRRLGIWGIAVRTAITRIGLAFWRPIRVLTNPLWKFVRWAAPFVWEELGRLGLATRRLLAVILWPLSAPAILVWDRLLEAPVTRLWNWFVIRAIVVGRAVRSRQRIQAARRHLRRREKMVANQNLVRDAGPPQRRWIRATAALVALNLVLLIVLARTLDDAKQLAEARPAPSSTARVSATPSPILLPTSTPVPTLIPVTPAPTPDHLASGGSVAFVQRVNGNLDIYALAVGLDKPVRLTTDSAEDRSPVWSPDGRLLAFSTRRDGNWELYLLKVASGELQRLTHHVDYEANPSWSPDGQWIIYESYHQENMDIYIMPAGGGDPVRLTTHPAADFAPAWAPSGRHIAFVSWRSGNPDIWLFSLDDARDEAAINISHSPDVEEGNPTWHPGGEYLAYSGKTSDQHLVYVQATVDNLPSGEPMVIGQGTAPAWAPSGNALVFAHDDHPNYFLLASSVNGWIAAPQVYLSQDPLGAPSWSAATLFPQLLTAAWTQSGRLDPAAVGDVPELYIESVAEPASQGPPFTMVTLEDIQVPGPYLSDRVDDSFQALRQRTIQDVGWDVIGALNKMWEPLDSPPPPGMDRESWNKAGRAFDLIPDLNAGFTPVLEIVREQEGAKTWWRVYVRTSRQDGSQGEPLTTRPWNFQARYSGNTSDYEDGGRLRDSIPAGYFVDFTQLAADYGWERVPAGETWRTNFAATLFWHFQRRQGLDWETAMRELYTELDLTPGMESPAQ